ncbi:MAG: hypothetical protein ACI4P0_00930 [Mailhella sp.]
MENDMLIYLVVFDNRATALGEKIYPDLEEYIDQNYVKAAHEEEYGAEPGRRYGIRPDAVVERSIAPTAEPIPAECPKMESAFSYETDSWFYDEDEEHETKLEERLKHVSDTFSQYLMYLIQEKQLENAEVWKRAIVDRKIFSKIKNNVNYHPQKLTALCLCVGAKLNLDESRDLLARAGYALSPCDKTDIIFSYFIENEIYDMIELDIQLEEHGLPCIIT